MRWLWSTATLSNRAEPADGLRREADLGHQHDGLSASARRRRSMALQVDLRLAAAGDAVKKEGGESVGIERPGVSWESTVDCSWPSSIGPRAASTASALVSSTAALLIRLFTASTRPAFLKAAIGPVRQLARRQASSTLRGDVERQRAPALRLASGGV